MLLKVKVLLFFALLLSGCASVTPTRHNLLPTELIEQPIVQIKQIPKLKFNHYQTFTVLNSSDLKKPKGRSKNNPLQMHLLFILRNALEGRGYKFVKPSQSPDFIATLDAQFKHSASYVKAKINKKSKWKLNARTYVKLNNKLMRGNYLKNMANRKQSYLNTKNTPQGLAGGSYYPQMNITIFDAKKKRVNWLGAAAGASKNKLTQVSSQLVIRALTRKIPLAKYRYKNFPQNTGRIGLGYAIISTDGKNYYPVITGLFVDGAAERGGLKKADYITEINNVTTLNKPLSTIAKMLTTVNREIMTFNIWRSGKPFKLTLMSLSR